MPDFTIEYFSVCPTVLRFETQIQGKTGTYAVSYGPEHDDGNHSHGWHCTCPSFRYRKDCKHLSVAKAQRCAWNEEAFCGSGAPRPTDGKCPNCGEPLETIKVAV